MWRYAVALLYCAGLSGCNSCNPVGPAQSHSGGRSQQPVGELTIGAWQPFGLSETDPQLMDAAELEDLKFNLIQFNPRQKFAAAVVDVTAQYDSLSGEQLTASFIQGTELSMPWYYEPVGFSDHDKLENWATCNFPEGFVAKCDTLPGYAQMVQTIIDSVREQYRGLNGALDGLQGYLLMNEIGDRIEYTSDFYSAMSAAIRVMRSVDPNRPAFVVERIDNFDTRGSAEQFMSHFFATGNPPNVFQHEDYVFRKNIPLEKEDPPQGGHITVQKQLDSLLDGYDRVCRLVGKFRGRWHAIVQAHGEDRPDAPLSAQLRKPEPGEIRVQVGLGLSRGASGIVYFVYSSGLEKKTHWTYHGLVDASGAPADGRYHAVKSINGYLDSISTTMRSLYFHGAISWREWDNLPSVGGNDLLRRVEIVRDTYDPLDASGAGHLEFGLFGDGMDTSHLLVVNRRTHVRQKLEIITAKQRVLDAARGDSLAMEVAFVHKLRRDRKFTLELEPGGFRLLRFE